MPRSQPIERDLSLFLFVIRCAIGTKQYTIAGYISSSTNLSYIQNVIWFQLNTTNC